MQIIRKIRNTNSDAIVFYAETHVLKDSGIFVGSDADPEKPVHIRKEEEDRIFAVFQAYAKAVGDFQTKIWVETIFK